MLRNNHYSRQEFLPASRHSVASDSARNSSEEKICFSRRGAPPGPSLGNSWPGFPPLGIARVVEPLSALIASREADFLFQQSLFAKAESPSRRGRWDVRSRSEKSASRPRRARPTQTVSNPVQQLPKAHLFSHYLVKFGINTFCFLNLRRSSAERPSKAGDSALRKL